MASSRMSVRELVGPVLIFIGALFVVAAIAMPLYLVGQFQKTPMDTDYTTVSTSQRTDGSSGSQALPAQILNRCSLTSSKPEVSPANLTRQQRVVVVKPANSDRVTFQAGTSVRINQVQISGETVTPSSDSTSGGGCLGALLSATKDRVTTNRTTGAPALSGGGSSEVQLDSSDKTVTIPDRRGLQYRFPFDTDKGKNYIYFDLASRTTSPLKYVDSTEINGVSVDHFSQEVPEANLASLKDANGGVPQGTQLTQTASWYGGFPGIDGKQVLPADLYRKTTRDLYVDPTTGTIVNDRERVQEYFKISGISDDAPDALKNFSLTNLDATFAYDQKTQEQRAADAKDLASPIKLWGRWMPIVFGILGVLALAAGIVLLLRGPRRTPATAGGEDPYYPVATQDTDAGTVGTRDDSANVRGSDTYGGSDDATSAFPDLRKRGGGAAGAGATDDDATQNIPRVTGDEPHGWSEPDENGPGSAETRRDDDPWKRT